jgi:hypothetical protein
MAAVRTFSLAFGFIAISDQSLELGMWNVICRLLCIYLHITHKVLFVRQQLGFKHGDDNFDVISHNFMQIESVPE